MVQKSEIKVEEKAQTFRTTHSDLQPFSARDTSSGMEHELQVAVLGQGRDVDLPLSITESTYFKNIVKRAERGDYSPKNLDALHSFIHDNKEQIWENSWVSFPVDTLHPQTRAEIDFDLRADKISPQSYRLDKNRFTFIKNNTTWYRFPVSYILKLALLDSCQNREEIKPLATKISGHFISDNTSPEILSFSIQNNKKNSIGVETAQEGALTFLLSQLLCQFANESFGLKEHGQTCLVYNAPHPPQRQKLLNELVPEGFYRHLFMSPCLSGWNRGEEKQAYMSLCHRALSSSQLNTIGKLKDSGIINHNLITLPNTSNTCLANNGTHVSLGSHALTSLAQKNIFTPDIEKYFGDLVIKIVEHFLPLFVGTYTAAPFRVDFADFHPEKMLGFLPHELDYTHLRMIWRRWKKKARIHFLGKEITPFGPYSLDSFLGKALRLQGDFIPDFRLIDYLVTLLSTNSSPCLNGILGNDHQLKQELSELGIFDPHMSIYLPYRMRNYSRMGYSGFENRSYSLFHNFMDDMKEAVDMQNFITALAYDMVLKGEIHHTDIPDTPFIESERRQIFFSKAIGIPTFYVSTATTNIFLKNILLKTAGTRQSRRYKGYTRVKVAEYQKALCHFMKERGKKLCKTLSLHDGIDRLEERLHKKASSTLGKITKGHAIDNRANKFSVPAQTYNSACEKYYRTTLKREQVSEGLDILLQECRLMMKNPSPLLVDFLEDSGKSPIHLIQEFRDNIVNEDCPKDILQHIIHIFLINFEQRNRHQ